MKHSASRTQNPKRSFTGRPAVLALLVVLFLGAAFVVGRSNGPAKASSTTTSSFPANTPFYLVLGGSSSLGLQPDGIPSDNAEYTENGYANDVVKLEQDQLHQTLDLDQLGCLGTRVIYLTVDPMSTACYKLPTTQLTTAVAFLKSHYGDSGIVSIDLGFNDIRFCLWEHPVNPACVPTALAGVKKGFPTLLSDLKAAAGPKVAIVGEIYYDPFLAFYLNGPTGPAIANASLSYIDQLNALLTADYEAAKIPFANTAAAFDTSDSTRVTIDNVGSEPANVKTICTYTWMCVGAPFGPDDHPNNAGYMLIAKAIVAALPAPWHIAKVK
jgi:lysophospholipase L1-like esterase